VEPKGAANKNREADKEQEENINNGRHTTTTMKTERNAGEDELSGLKKKQRQGSPQEED